MNGRRRSFEIGEVKIILARATMAEMFAIEPLVTGVLGDPEVSEFAGDIDEILKRAVEHESDEDKAALEAMQDAGDRLELFDQYVEFAGFTDFLLQRALKRLERIKRMRVAQMMQAGITEAEAEAIFKGNLTTLQDSMNASLPGITSHQTPLTGSTTGTP